MTLKEHIERDPARHAFARMWPGRHDDRVHVFASGHVFDRAQRREGIRQNISAQRSHRVYWQAQLA